MESLSIFTRVPHGLGKTTMQEGLLDAMLMNALGASQIQAHATFTALGEIDPLGKPWDPQVIAAPCLMKHDDRVVNDFPGCSSILILTPHPGWGGLTPHKDTYAPPNKMSDL